MIVAAMLGATIAAAQEGRGPGGTPCGAPFDTGCLPGYHCQPDQRDAEGRVHHDSAFCAPDGVAAPNPASASPSDVGLALAAVAAIVAVGVMRSRARRRSPPVGPT